MRFLNPLISKQLRSISNTETILLKRLVANLRARRVIEQDVVNFCNLERAAQLLIEAEDIVRTEPPDTNDTPRPVVTVLRRG